MRRYVLPLTLFVLAALGLWWFTRLQVGSARAPLVPPRSADGAGSRGASTLEAAAGAARAEPRLTPAPGAATPSTQEPRQASATVRARCLDDRGLPIAGVELQGDGEHTLATSAADGVVEARMPLWRPDGGEMWIVLRERYHVQKNFSRVLLPDALCDLGDVVLAPAGCIEGRVVDERGRPVAKAALSSSRIAFSEWAESQEPDSSWAASSEDGAFLLQGVPCGTMRVRARGEGYAPAERSPLEVLAGQDLRGIEIALVEHAAKVEPGFVVRVRTPAGEPLPGAKIVCDIRESGSQSFGTSTADEHGERRLFAGAQARICARALDPAGVFSPASAFDVPGSRGVLELRLGQTTQRTLFVSDEQGAPVERFAFRLLQPLESTPLPGLAPTDEHGLLRCSLPDPGTTAEFGAQEEQRQMHPGGRAELRAPPASFVIQIDAREFALAQFGPFAPESAPAEIHVTLQRQPGIRGIVSAEGKPCAGAWVKLFEAPGRQRETLVDEFPSRVAARALLTTSSAEDGSFVFELRDAGDYEVQAGAPEHGVAEFGPVHLVPSAGAKDLVLELPGLGALEGRVLANPGATLRDLVVGVSRGDGRAFSVRTDAEGRYHFEKLTPGRWLVRLLRQDVDPHGESCTLRDEPAPDGPFPSCCEVRANETTRADIDLRQSAELAMSVQIAGWETSHWTASLEPAGAVQCRGANVEDVDLEHLRLRVDQPGEYLLRLDARVAEGKHWLGFYERVQLEAGLNTWKFAAETGGLVLANRKEDPLWAYMRCRLAGGRDVHVGVEIPAHGELTLGGIPLGTWARIDSKDGRSIENGTSVVAAGAPGRLEWK
jgi:hypothetical protein